MLSFMVMKCSLSILCGALFVRGLWSGQQASAIMGILLPVGEHGGGCPQLQSGLWVSQEIQPWLLLGSHLKLSFPDDWWVLHVSILLWMGCLILKCTNFGLLKTSTYVSCSLISLVSLHLN